MLITRGLVLLWTFHETDFQITATEPGCHNRQPFPQGSGWPGINTIRSMAIWSAIFFPMTGCKYCRREKVIGMIVIILIFTLKIGFNVRPPQPGW